MNGKRKRGPYVDYYSASQRKEILPLVTAWMNLGYIMLSETSQKNEDKYHIILLIWRNLKKGKKRIKKATSNDQ